RSWCWCRSYRLVVYEYAAVDCVGDVDIAAGIRPHIQGTPQAAGAHAAVIRSAGSEAAELSKHQISSIVVERSVVFEHAAVGPIGDEEIAARIHRQTAGLAQAGRTQTAIVAAMRCE